MDGPFLEVLKEIYRPWQVWLMKNVCRIIRWVWWSWQSSIQMLQLYRVNILIPTSCSSLISWNSPISILNTTICLVWHLVNLFTWPLQRRVTCFRLMCFSICRSYFSISSAPKTKPVTQAVATKAACAMVCPIRACQSSVILFYKMVMISHTILCLHLQITYSTLRLILNLRLPSASSHFRVCGSMELLLLLCLKLKCLLLVAFLSQSTALLSGRFWILLAVSLWRCTLKLESTSLTSGMIL